MSDEFTVRKAKPEEYHLLLSWYQNESWNPGLSDIRTCISTPGSNIFVGTIDDQPVSSLSAFIYHKNFAFIGYYLVERPELRNKGYGMRLWQHVFVTLEKAGIQAMGLDAVPEQIDNYQRSGFSKAYLHQRYLYLVNGNEACDPNVIRRQPPPEQVISFDAQFVQEPRSDFIRAWLDADDSRHHVHMIDVAGKLCGYAAIRKATQGYRIGPLYAQDEKSAELIFKSLCKELPPDTEVYMDIPETNQHRHNLIDTLQLQLLEFDCMRMYRGKTLSRPINNVFGVCSIEMG